MEWSFVLSWIGQIYLSVRIDTRIVCDKDRFKIVINFFILSRLIYQTRSFIDVNIEFQHLLMRIVNESSESFKVKEFLVAK